MWHYTYYIILPLWNVGIFLLFFTYMALFFKRISRRGCLRRRSVVYNIISLFRFRSCFFLFIIIISPSTWPKKREKRRGKGKQLDKKKICVHSSLILSRTHFVYVCYYYFYDFGIIVIIVMFLLADGALPASRQAWPPSYTRYFSCFRIDVKKKLMFFDSPLFYPLNKSNVLSSLVVGRRLFLFCFLKSRRLSVVGVLVTASDIS